jgi:sugar phosphate isomerase/epimerase
MKKLTDKPYSGQLTRRECLKLLSSAAVLSSVPISSLAASIAGREFNFGVQLSTLNSIMRQDFEGSLAKVHDIGYTMVEFSAGGFLGEDPQLVKGYLEKYQLNAPVGRISPRPPANFASLSGDAQSAYRARSRSLDGLLDNVRASLQDTALLGQKYLNLPSAPAEEFTSRSKVERVAAIFNEAGKLCQQQGVLFGYHNHAFEFVEVDGILPYDLLLAETDPELVSFQLDSYWVRKGGGDLSHYITEHPNRFPTIHLKDIDSEGDFADVGDGLIDFPEFITQALDHGARYFFVERDGPPQPLQSITRSFDYLSALNSA